MRRRRSWVVGAGVLVAATVGVVGGGTPASGWTREPQRIAGADRYQTAVDLSNAAFPTGAPAAVVVNGQSFPDGLAAGPLAALRGGPVLLTTATSLPPAVTAELTRLRPATVAVVGGAAVVSDDVVGEIAAATGVAPERIAGPDRYATAAAVAERFPREPVAAYVASGLDFPDALAGGAVAAIDRVPLLLTMPEEAPQATTDAVIALAPGELRILGGPAAVSDAAVSQLSLLRPARRLAGPDRYATAQVVATDGGRRPAEILVATGAGFPDALAAAGLAAVRGAPLLLTAAPCAPWPTVDAQRDLGWPDVTIVGGTGIVSVAAGRAVPCSDVRDGPLAPGVLLTTQVLPGPRVVHLVTIDRRQGHDVRAVTTTGQVNGLTRVTSLARRLGTPVVAVNGDFFDPAGEPTHALAVAGRILRWPGSLGNTLVGLDPGKPGYAFFNKPRANGGGGGVDVDLGAAGTLGVGLVNMRAPNGEELALVTREWTRAFPEGAWCRAGLQPAGPSSFDAEARTLQPVTVSGASCGTGAIPRGTDDVLVARAGTTIGQRLAALRPGTTGAVRWKAHPSSLGLTDVVGSNATLVLGGNVASDVALGQGPFWTRREARTAIAQRPDGTLLLAVVAKRPGWSVGMTPRELAEHLVRLGASDAANLDGGGSSTIAVRGVLANRPSDGAERGVNTALVVVPAGSPTAPATATP